MQSVFSLEGKKGIVTGLANADSIAFGCAKALHEAGAKLLLTYGHAKSEPHITPLLPALGHPSLVFCDVRDDAQLQALFAQAEEEFGTLDFVIHAIAFANREDLHGRVVDSSKDGFALAMDISCHSFIRMARLAEPLMPQGGCLLTMTYQGASKVVPTYSLMGPVKAALESSVRYMAEELGPQGIRVHAISPGLIKTRAASGIAGFDAMMQEESGKTPLRRLVDIHDIGQTSVFLISDAGRSLTGNIVLVDAGANIKA